MKSCQPSHLSCHPSHQSCHPYTLHQILQAFTLILPSLFTPLYCQPSNNILLLPLRTFCPRLYTKSCQPSHEILSAFTPHPANLKPNPASLHTKSCQPSHQILPVFTPNPASIHTNPAGLHTKFFQPSHQILPAFTTNSASLHNNFSQKSRQILPAFATLSGVSLQTNFCQSSHHFVSAFIPTPASLQNTSCRPHTKSFQPSLHFLSAFYLHTLLLYVSLYQTLLHPSQDFLSVFKTCSVSL
jgi:hypothetical protein